MIPKYSCKPRSGFSLVELLVAMAIIIFMLSIMSQAFVIATTCMQGMKSVGELVDRTRPVLTLMQKDLSADHFDGTKKLSDANFWDYGPPKEGYFSIVQGGVSEAESKPTDAVKYYISNSSNAPDQTKSNHVLAFSSRLSGKTPTDFYSAEFPSAQSTGMSQIFNYPASPTAADPNLMKSLNSKRFDFVPGTLHAKWAEIAYFIKPNGQVIKSDPAQTPVLPDLQLHDLYRQQRILLPDVADMNRQVFPGALSNDFYEYSHHVDSVTGKLVFNQPSDLTAPWKRFGNRTAPPLALPNFKTYADPAYLPAKLINYSDLVLPNVISFDVRVLTDQLDFVHLVENNANFGGYSNFNPGMLNAAASWAIFDTWTTERSQDPNRNYDLGDLSSGTWRPSSVPPTGSTYIPFWNTVVQKGPKINAIQITIRIWDEKSSLAKDFVLIQKI